MSSLKAKTSKRERRKKASMDVATVIQKGMDKNPDVQVVLEIAMRARNLESVEPPRSIGMATDVVALPTNSQCPV